MAFDAVVGQLMRVPVGGVTLHLEVVPVVLTSLLVHVSVRTDVCQFNGRSACQLNGRPACQFNGRPACQLNGRPVCQFNGRPFQIQVCQLNGRPIC